MELIRRKLMQTLLRKALLVSGLALGAAVLGVIAAVPTHLLPPAETTSLAIRAQHGATNEPDSAYYYFPSQFRAPEGPIAEPIATF
jgi:hypothetical protein